MVYRSNTTYPNATAYIAPQIINDHPTKVLIVSLPLTDHADVRDMFAGVTEISDVQDSTITRYAVRMHYDTRDDAEHSYAWLLLDDYSVGDNPAYYQAQTKAATDENTELVNLLGDVAQQEYVKAMEEINNV